MTTNVILRNLFYVVFNPITSVVKIDDNKLAFKDNFGTALYTFNEDGTIDYEPDETLKQYLIDNGFNPEDYTKYTYKNYNELINFGNGWFFDFPYTVEDLITMMLDNTHKENK